ncbi:hypothetical protein O181_096632 [Austropuccinia psidii MF-1]|uniref:CCHC-type domain-containing protein n=1 Tax=Austropuccinia psidii MF-1 TaxID=1389203 RepID=A0A9Q3J706_9BASI|nr:hypothetical protein [Austropuccinia psidii MF-1]
MLGGNSASVRISGVGRALQSVRISGVRSMLGGHSASIRMVSSVRRMSGVHSASVRMVSSVRSMLGGHFASVRMGSSVGRALHKRKDKWCRENIGRALHKRKDKWCREHVRSALRKRKDDISDTMINMKILRTCGGELEDAIRSRCVEPCSTEDYINEMEDIITRTRIGKTWTRIPMESKMVPKIPREDKRSERPVLKCHKCGSTSHLANTCTKKTKINEVQVIEGIQCTEEKEESDQDSAVSEDTPVEDYPIENITDFFEVTEVHTHLPQYSEDCCNLINIQDARMCKTKPARGKGYTSGESCITSVLMCDI